jgi:protein ImuA
MPKSSPPTSLDALRARIRALEAAPLGPQEAVMQGATVHGGAAAVPFGVAGIDGALPWGGLPRACLHEIVGDASGEGFSAALLARLIAGRGPALWCLAHGELYGPGLGVFGLDPDRLVVARARRSDDVLWAMEEGLRSGQPGAVLGEVRGLDLTAGRRLQLAARAGRVTCLALRPPEAGSAPGAAVTRWRVDVAPSLPVEGLPGLGRARWRVELARCRGASAHRWLLEWNDETRHFAVVSVLAERTAGPAAGVEGHRRAG